MLAVQRRTRRPRRRSCRSDEGDSELYGDDVVDVAEAAVTAAEEHQCTTPTRVQIVPGSQLLQDQH